LVPVVRDHRGDRRCRGTPQGVEDDEQLDQVVTDRVARRLHQEHVVAANRLTDFDVELAIREARDLALGELHPDLAGDALAELGIAAPREQQQLTVGVRVGHDRNGPRADHPSTLRCRLLPTASAPGGTSWSMKEPAPMKNPPPTPPGAT